ncbi:hypothetical protein CDS [Bradyrhizobium sp.]|nr:hypothetical protein CDS [Bradyrhizobium sp.]
MDHDADRFADAAFSFRSRSHAHCSLNSGRRSQSALLPRTAHRFAAQGDCPDSDNEGQFRRKAEFAQADLRPRTFRRLSGATQSRIASKLNKTLILNENYKNSPLPVRAWPAARRK